MAPKHSLPEQIRTTCRILDDKKAENLRVFHAGGETGIADYVVLATGTSEPHLRALRTELEKTLKEGQVRLVGTEGDVGTGWTVYDGFDFMVHLFTKDMRAHYNLEDMWGRQREIPLAEVLTPAFMPATTKKPAVKSAAKKPAAKKAAPKAKAPAKKAAPKAKVAAKKPAAKKPAAKAAPAAKKAVKK